MADLFILKSGVMGEFGLGAMETNIRKPTVGCGRRPESSTFSPGYQYSVPRLVTDSYYTDRAMLINLAYI